MSSTAKPAPVSRLPPPREAPAPPLRSQQQRCPLSPRRRRTASPTHPPPPPSPNPCRCLPSRFGPRPSLDLVRFLDGLICRCCCRGRSWCATRPRDGSDSGVAEESVEGGLLQSPQRLASDCTDNVSEEPKYVTRCTRSKFVHHPSSFSYKRMLPFLMDNDISSQ